MLIHYVVFPANYKYIMLIHNVIFSANLLTVFYKVRKTCQYYDKAADKLDNTSFFFLRYEDMSTDPVKTADNIYSFIGHDISDELASWIKSSQEATGASGGTYSTIRNSTATMTAWRKSISFDEVSQK